MKILLQKCGVDKVWGLFTLIHFLLLFSIFCFPTHLTEFLLISWWKTFFAASFQNKNKRPDEVSEEDWGSDLHFLLKEELPVSVCVSVCVFVSLINTPTCLYKYTTHISYLFIYTPIYVKKYCTYVFISTVNNEFCKQTFFQMKKKYCFITNSHSNNWRKLNIYSSAGSVQLSWSATSLFFFVVHSRRLGTGSSVQETLSPLLSIIHLITG